MGTLWVTMGTDGNLWGPMGTLVDLWGPVGMYGALWGLFRDSGCLVFSSSSMLA